MKRLLDFSRTAAALKRRDYWVPRIWETVERIIDSLGAHSTDEQAKVANSKIRRLYARIHDLDRNVGVAFGLDTARPDGPNDPETCAQCVRPGDPVPPPGFQESMVRKLVREWSEARQ